jgi:uncharacterized membrane protein YgdD (TMEM256/DUF423 family)
MVLSFCLYDFQEFNPPSTMTTRYFIRIGALAALLGVLAGTFGAHGLKDRLETDLLTVFETGARYHMYHAFALILIGCLPGGLINRGTIAAGWLFLAGIVIFSGSLYTLALTGERWLGMITPIGGTAFMLGWLVLAISTWRSHRSP